MELTEIQNANLIMTAPKGTESFCADLPVRRGYDGKTGSGYMQSAWKPTEVEIANILAGRPVILTIFGDTHPIVSLSVE